MLRFLRSSRTLNGTSFTRCLLRDYRDFSALPSWATVDPNRLTRSEPGIGQNLGKNVFLQVHRFSLTDPQSEWKMDKYKDDGRHC